MHPSPPPQNFTTNWRIAAWGCARHLFDGCSLSEVGGVAAVPLRHWLDTDSPVQQKYPAITAPVRNAYAFAVQSAPKHSSKVALFFLSSCFVVRCSSSCIRFVVPLNVCAIHGRVMTCCTRFRVSRGRLKVSWGKRLRLERRETQGHTKGRGVSQLRKLGTTVDFGRYSNAPACTWRICSPPHRRLTS
jgi:hypothetical protein